MSKNIILVSLTLVLLAVMKIHIIHNIISTRYIIFKMTTPKVILQTSSLVYIVCTQIFK
jgi:hypothetical protein